MVTTLPSTSRPRFVPTTRWQAIPNGRANHNSADFRRAVLEFAPADHALPSPPPPELVTPELAEIGSSFRETEEFQEFVNLLEQLSSVDAELPSAKTAVETASGAAYSNATAEHGSLESRQKMLTEALKRQYAAATNALVELEGATIAKIGEGLADERQAILDEISELMTPLINRLHVNTLRHRVSTNFGLPSMVLGGNPANMAPDDRATLLARLKNDLGE